MTTAEKYEFDCTTSTKRSRKRKQTKIQADLPTITLQCNQTQYWEKLQTRNTPNLGEMTFQGLSQKTIVLDSVVIPFFTGVLTRRGSPTFRFDEGIIHR
jgi:hypothetical protein